MGGGVKRIFVISNGSHIDRAIIDKISVNFEVIFLAKTGCFDSSVLYAYDLIKGCSSEYIYLQGDDDMPILENVFEALQVMQENCNLLVSSDMEPLGKSFCYKEMLQKFIGHFPLGSVLFRKDAFQLCSREVLVYAQGSWHAYAMIAFDAASRMNKVDDVLYMNRLPFRSIISNGDTESPKTYVMDSKMVTNLKKFASLLDTSILSEQERHFFYYQFTKLAWSYVA